MFSVDELLSKRNQRDALAHFKTKRDGCDSNGMRVSELEEYWKLNQERIRKEIVEEVFCPGVITNKEIVNGKGKKRIISSLTIPDRFITRLLAQKLKRYLEPGFMKNSFAYQEGKGILDAVMLAKQYIEQGNKFVVEIDLKDFFDIIPLIDLYVLLEKRINDRAVLGLLYKYLFCKIVEDNKIVDKKQGLVQGNSISPILSNLYLNEFDGYMESQGMKWFRYADNIYIYIDKMQTAEMYFEELTDLLCTKYKLQINSHKSGIYNAIERQILGYEFYLKNGGVEVRKHSYKKLETFHNWHKSVIQQVNHEYHLVQDGVLNKKDYALLFENDKEKHHIPVEVIDNLNIYGDVTISTSVLKTLTEKNIRLSVVNKYGDLLGYFIPDGYVKDSKTMLKQSLLYENLEKRLSIAKQMEIAGIHNMRSNVRYYNKKQNLQELKLVIGELDSCIEMTKNGKTIEELMLIEARARQKYYMTFNYILKVPGFEYVKRSKRPPEDAINAMISFGNTLLYNMFMQNIWKTSLDPRVGIIHAANRRSHSLNLDFADIFKPIIVDRVIFTLINLHQIKSDEDFEQSNNGGIYLSKNGKKKFLEEFEEKLNSTQTIDGKMITYKKLMEQEVSHYQKMILNDERYKPYKYY